MFREFDKNQQMVRHSAYSRHIARMQRFLTTDDLKLIAYDDIEARPDALLVDIENFLGISHHKYLPGKVSRKINTSEALAAPDCFYKVFSTPVNNELDALAELGFEIPPSWLDHTR
jgi:hypothetical protein